MIPEISMASILAKVARDEYMQELPPRFKKYRFEQHKGYGTKLHYELLQQHGISSLHRKRFLNRD